ncbi:MAG: multifunctional CCA addition/repair protein [Pseudomonadota bacterium]
MNIQRTDTESENRAESGLQCYVVGGAVRDRLLGLKVSDRDWVVVGSTTEDMVRRGFRPVGKSFPVFLHPETGEEYALARTERKISKGYTGFETHSDPTVTLDQDLLRRDLTINAIAEDKNGELIDPCKGSVDLKNKVIRHVSDAFEEDPLRVLRVARFAARFNSLGFAVHQDTCRLMSRIADSGELETLTAERCWLEISKALQTDSFFRFIEVLRESSALEIILPEVNALFGVPQTKTYHPEVDTGTHLLMALRAVQQETRDPRIVFAVLLHDLGKALTPEEQWPKHRGHEQAGIEPVNRLCDRLKVPETYRRLALRVCELHLLHHRFAELKPATMLKMFEKLDYFRNPTHVEDFAIACRADLRGRKGLQNRPVPQTRLIKQAAQCLDSVDASSIAKQITRDHDDGSSVGEKIAEGIRRQRLAALKNLKKTWAVESSE